jgi:hypothetical protein
VPVIKRPSRDCFEQFEGLFPGEGRGTNPIGDDLFLREIHGDPSYLKLKKVFSFSESIGVRCLRKGVFSMFGKPKKPTGSVLQSYANVCIRTKNP